jgi:CheY-like chemotaxis protein
MKVGQRAGSLMRTFGAVRVGSMENMGTLNILLVDDDRNLVTTFSHGLRKAMGKGTSVVFCANGPEALALLATQTFDLVISDFHMPGMSGLELLKQIKQDHHETRLVLITAYTTETLEADAHQLGISYITKPFELPLLVELIQNLISGKEKPGATEKISHILVPEGNTEPDHSMSNTI